MNRILLSLAALAALSGTAYSAETVRLCTGGPSGNYYGAGETIRQMAGSSLEIVKHVIAVKIDERKRADAAADRADKRRKLIEALANKQDDAIRNLSEDEIRAKLAELDDAA